MASRMRRAVESRASRHRADSVMRSFAKGPRPGTNGIGKEIVRGLAKRGVYVPVTGRDLRTRILMRVIKAAT